MCLTRQGGHEILLGDLLADGIQHLRIVADIVELGVVLDVSNVDGTAVGLSVVSCSSVPLESVVSLGADGQNAGGIEGNNVVAINDVDAHVENGVGGVYLEELGTGGDGIVIYLLSEIYHSSARFNGILSADWVRLGVDSHDVHEVLRHLLAELYGLIDGQAIAQQFVQQLEITQVASRRNGAWNDWCCLK